MSGVGASAISFASKLPSSTEEGKAATSRKKPRSAPKWSGRGGVVKKPILSHTTPSARIEVASRLFWGPRSHPSSAEEGSLLLLRRQSDLQAILHVEVGLRCVVNSLRVELVIVIRDFPDACRIFLELILS